MKTRREILEEFVAADPDDAFSRYALALELLKEERELEAVTQLQEVIGRDPDYVPAYYQLGRALARLGQVDDARATYRRGLDAATQAGDQKTRAELQEAIDMLD
jgi:Tfp pilus assembly protein PilF